MDRKRIPLIFETTFAQFCLQLKASICDLKGKREGRNRPKNTKRVCLVVDQKPLILSEKINHWDPLLPSSKPFKVETRFPHGDVFPPPTTVPLLSTVQLRANVLQNSVVWTFVK